MTAIDILSDKIEHLTSGSYTPTVDRNADAGRIIAALASSPTGKVAVTDEAGRTLGEIDSAHMLSWISTRLLPAQPETSWISGECAPSDYSASQIARAVEDADAHLIDLFTAPSSGGKTRFSLRISIADPESAVRSLERYGYEIISADSYSGNMNALTERRLAELALYLNI